MKIFDKYGIKTTFFIPGHSLETFPEECKMIAEAGHEIGLHGYSHENPIAMTLEQQTAIMDKCYRLISDFQGRPPRGIVAPWWESSQEGAELMLKYGLTYDHSFSHHDCQCYYLRTGDKWIPIDYKKHRSSGHENQHANDGNHAMFARFVLKSPLACKCLGNVCLAWSRF